MSEVLAAAKEWGAFAFIAILLIERGVSYLKARDAAERGGGAGSTGEKASVPAIRQYQVDQAIIEIASQTKVQTDLLRQCVEGHNDTRAALSEMKAALTYLAKPNGRSTHA